MERLIDFLDTLGRMPGCAVAFAWRDRLRESQYRRNKLRGTYYGTIGRAKSLRRASADLFAPAGGAAAQAVPSAAAATAEPMPMTTSLAGSDDRTLLRPRPAGREAIAPAPRAEATAVAAPSAPFALRGSGLNPLVDAATTLLTLCGRLPQLRGAPDLRHLRAEAARQLRAFETAARRAGVPPEQLVAARYALCALLDEAVLASPWGADSPWARHSLLSEFHGETWGGEKFFLILERLLAEPVRHLALLEFMDLCLALGMQGRYRIADGGAGRLQDLRRTVYEAIRRVRGEPAQALSPQWRGAPPQRAKLARMLPLWAAAALGGLVLAGAYGALAWRLGRQAEPVYAALGRLGEDRRLALPVAPVPRTLSLREVLAPEIAAGLVEVSEQAGGSVIEIRGDGLFESGSVDVDPAVQPVLERIGAALDPFAGAIRVTGHTDNQPIAMSRRLRWTSNWELSQARADAVAAVLSRRLAQPARVVAEGRGDADPRSPNDTPAHRAQNRRVDITLMGPAVVQAAAPALSRRPS
jgi:type VI secretion system protein ImpK